MGKETLYEDTQLKVTYLLKKGKIVSTEDHELHFLASGNRYFIGRSTLRELAHTPRSKLEDSLNRISPEIKREIMQESLSFEAVGLAIAKAYIRGLENRDK